MKTTRHARVLRLPRFAIGAGLTAFFVLAGTGVASAVWTSTPSPISSTVSAGTVDVSYTGANGLNATYGSGALTDTAPVTVSNTGTVPANSYTIQIIAATATTLASNTTLSGWYVVTATDCNSAAVMPIQSVSASLTAGLSYSTSLAAGTSQIFCVRTSIPGSYVTDGSTSQPRLTVSYATGSWTGSSFRTLTQTVKDSTAPSAPGAPAASGTTSSQTAITWSTATDNIGVSSYQVFRNGTSVGTVTAPTVTFTDTGLVRGTTYSYTVKALDAAGNISAGSPATAVTTRVVDNNARYSMANPNSGLCIDAGSAGSTPTDGTVLVVFGCATARVQSWQFVATAGNNFKIVASNFTTLGWDIDNGNGAGQNDGQKAQLWGYVGSSNQQWQVISEGAGKVHFVNQNGANKCLDITAAGTAPGTPLQQYTCNGTAAQTFTLTQLP